MKTIHSKRHPWIALTVLSCGIVIAGSSWTACAGETNELFLKNCAVCHGKDGRADSTIAKKLGVKDLSQRRLNDSQIEQ